ncbi:MAG TPA: rod shape-determining protein [Candidatus Magasanikbacteria bacterium]|nr:rod shape-determining protein [Candidatus Magasanikbacteria bacterium]
MFIKKVGIDLGTNNVMVYVPKKGIAVNEPGVVAISKTDGKILAVGLEAKDMTGRTPDSIIAEHPLKEGVIANYRTTEAMLRYFINKALGGIHLFRPEVMVAVPAGITSTERRAVIDATIAAGARAAYLIKAPLVAAIGADIPIGAASGHMVIDIGAGTAEIAVISLGGIVSWGSVRIGGNKFDQSIGDFVRRKYNLEIGVHTAEEIKTSVGSAMYMAKPLSTNIKGRDLVTGLPRIVSVSSDDVTEALQHDLNSLVNAIKEVLHKTPPELSADVMDKGIILTGGSALLRNLDELVTQATGVPTYVADEPMFCAAKGTGIALENIESYKRSILATK